MNKIRIPFTEFNFTFSRSSGAGGQNINKVNSKVTLNWDMKNSPSCSLDVKERLKSRFPNFIVDDEKVQIIGQKYRSQKANIDDCIERLHTMLAEVAIPPKRRKATKPKRSAVLKRLQSKKKDSEKKKLRQKDY